MDIVTEENNAGLLATATAAGTPLAPVENRMSASSDAASKKAQAEIECAYVMATKFPRNLAVVHQSALVDARRPSFAEAALYEKPVSANETVSGISIRGAEALARHYGHVRIDYHTTHEDDKFIYISASILDVQSGMFLSGEVQVSKTMERKFLKDGQEKEVIDTRINNQGKKIYILPAPDTEIVLKRNNLLSKEIRNLILRIIPADIKEDFEQEVRNTLASGAKKDPEGTLKKMTAAFLQLGVDVKDIEAFTGKSIKKLTPKEVADLGVIYSSIKDGEASWEDFAQQKQDAKPPAKPPHYTPSVEGSKDEPAAAPSGEESDDQLLERAKAELQGIEAIGKTELQRVLKIGHGKASALITRMQAEGLMGEQEGKSPMKLFLNGNDDEDTKQEPPAEDPPANDPPNTTEKITIDQIIDKWEKSGYETNQLKDCLVANEYLLSFQGLSMIEEEDCAEIWSMLDAWIEAMKNS